MRSLYMRINMRDLEKLFAYLFFKGPQEGCLNSVTYASMIHLQTLQNYLRLVSTKLTSLHMLFICEIITLIEVTKKKKKKPSTLEMSRFLKK